VHRHPCASPIQDPKVQGLELDLLELERALLGPALEQALGRVRALVVGAEVEVEEEEEEEEAEVAAAVAVAEAEVVVEGVVAPAAAQHSPLGRTSYNNLCSKSSLCCHHP